MGTTGERPDRVCYISKNRHATAHFHATGHPIVKSFEPGEKWLWCYVDEVMLPLKAKRFWQRDG